MKKIVKGLGTLVFCFFFAYISIQSVYAVGFGGGSRGGSFGTGGFGGSTIKTEVSYDALSELCILINDQITQGLFDSVPPFSKTSSDLAATVRYDSVNGYYVISVKSGATYYNFLNNSGGVYCAYKADLEVDPDADYGEQVLMWMHNIYDYVSTISHSLTDTDGPFWLWMKKFDAQNDLTNINLELIDLGIQDMIEAIEGISISGDGDGSPVVFDTLPITDKLTTLYEAIERFHYDFNVFASQSGEDSDYSKAIVDAIDQLHYDFDRYFSQFGDIIEYGEVEYVVEGQQTVEWDDNYYSYISGDLTSGSSVRTFRLPTLYGVTGSPASIRIRDNDGYPSIYADDIVYDEFSFSGRGIPGSFYLSYNGNRHSVNLSEIADSGTLQGKSVTIRDGVPGGEISITFLGKTTQSGTPTESNPVPLRNLGVRAGVISATVSNGEGRSHVINAVLPDSGLAGLPVDGNSGNYTDENGQRWFADFVYDGKYYVQCIKTVTFDGSADEGWFNNYAGTSNYAFCCDVGKFGDVLDGVIMSDRYTPAVVTSTTTDKGIYIYNSASADVARICVRGDNTFSSSAALRAWISEHPFTVSYVLSQPILHELRVPPEYMGSLTGTIYEESITEVTSNSFMYVDYAAKNPVAELYMGEDNFWRVRYADSTVFHLTDSAVVSALNDAFSVREYTSADSILLHNGLNSVFVTNGGTLTMNLLRGSKFVNWFVNWQHSSRDWLDQKLDSLQITSGGGSDLTPVISRMDTIIENLGAEVGVVGCEHVYVSEINQEQTCVLPGLQTFTCQSCGSSYSEILSSLGHDWLCTGHVDDELDPETGEVISSGYDVYTCSRCDGSYNDYEGSGAPAEENSSITGIISRVFEKLGSLVGELLSMGIRLLDKLLSGFDEIVTSFNEKTEQIINFGSGYTAWLSGFWEIIPADLMLAWGFCLVVICVGIIGKKLFFTS